MSNVDWQSLVTRHFVDDFATHLRLYRSAADKLALAKAKNPSDPADLQFVETALFLHL